MQVHPGALLQTSGIALIDVRGYAVVQNWLRNVQEGLAQQLSLGKLFGAFNFWLSRVTFPQIVIIKKEFLCRKAIDRVRIDIQILL